MRKTGFVMGPFEVDWTGPGLEIALEVCENPPGYLVREAAEFGLLPLSSLCSMLLRLVRVKDKVMAGIVGKTFLDGMLSAETCPSLAAADGSPRPSVKCYWPLAAFEEFQHKTIAPIETSPFFMLLSVCMEYVDAFFELVEWSTVQKFELVAGARFLAKLFPRQAVGLMKALLRGFDSPMAVAFASAMVQDWITPVEGRWFGRFAVEQFGADRAISISKQVCLLAAEEDPVGAGQLHHSLISYSNSCGPFACSPAARSIQAGFGAAAGRFPRRNGFARQSLSSFLRVHLQTGDFSLS
jgi:hypothetical protein